MVIGVVCFCFDLVDLSLAWVNIYSVSINEPNMPPVCRNNAHPGPISNKHTRNIL